MDKEILLEIRTNIKKARKYAKLSEEYETKVFNMLDEIRVDAEAYKTKAENASNLQQAISCYISYNEYSLNGLMKEIENAMR